MPAFFFFLKLNRSRSILKTWHDFKQIFNRFELSVSNGLQQIMCYSGTLAGFACVPHNSVNSKKSAKSRTIVKNMLKL